MPALTVEQLDALRADIAAHGVQVPITVDQHGRILDGNNRAAIAAELGIDCPSTTVVVADDADAIDRAVTLNCARRHLTREQVRGIIAAEILRRPDDSDRAIARRVGCSPSTVGAVRVSKLDTSPLGFEAATELTQEIARRSAQIHDDLLTWVRKALGAGMPPAEVDRMLVDFIQEPAADLDDELAAALRTFTAVVFGPVRDSIPVGAS